MNEGEERKGRKEDGKKRKRRGGKDGREERGRWERKMGIRK